MARPVKPTGTAEYPRRRARATATRARVVEAAMALFIERGYVATTIDAIAERADVSAETIYSTFGNKRALRRGSSMSRSRAPATPVRSSTRIGSRRCAPSPIPVVGSGRWRAVGERSSSAARQWTKSCGRQHPPTPRSRRSATAARPSGSPVSANSCGSSSASRACDGTGPRHGRRHPLCDRQPRDLSAARGRPGLEWRPIRALVRRHHRAPAPRTRLRLRSRA